MSSTNTVTLKTRTLLWVGVLCGLGFEASIQSILNLLNALLNHVVPTLLSLLPEYASFEKVAGNAPGWLIQGFIGWWVLLMIIVSGVWCTRFVKGDD